MGLGNAEEKHGMSVVELAAAVAGLENITCNFASNGRRESDGAEVVDNHNAQNCMTRLQRVN